MSYITFDYLCTQCDKREPRLVKRNMQDNQLCCGVPMVKLPAAPRTTFRFADNKLKE